MNNAAALTLLATTSLLMTPTTANPKLEPCPGTPNCVSTQAKRASQRMEPIPYTGDVDAARARLLAVLAEHPRVEVSVGEGGEIRAVFTSRLLRFKDDVVLAFDPQARLIHFRSASRLGRSDFGVNRERMERLSRLFLEAESEAPPH